MSDSITLHTFVDARFHEAFGKPHTSMGKDDHWRLQKSPWHLPINVLLNGTRDIPALWIFDDAHDDADGVFSASITHEDQVGDLIVNIQARVHRAGIATCHAPRALHDPNDMPRAEDIPGRSNNDAARLPDRFRGIAPTTVESHAGHPFTAIWGDGGGAFSLDNLTLEQARALSRLPQSTKPLASDE